VFAVSYQQPPTAEADRIEALLRGRPELLTRFQAGDTSALVELIEAVIGAEVRSAEVRLIGHLDASVLGSFGTMGFRGVRVTAYSLTSGSGQLAVTAWKLNVEYDGRQDGPVLGSVSPAAK